MPSHSLTDFLGSDREPRLRGKAKTATYEDLLRTLGFDPPDDPKPLKVLPLNDDELLSIAEAIQEKTGWVYNKPAPPACCCTWPGWPR